MDYEDEETVAQGISIIPDEEIVSSRSPLPMVFDTEQQVAAMEKAVLFGPRLIKARNTLIRMFTYSEDWTCFGEGDKAKACLSAAGAMRIADKGNFPIRFFNVQGKKENIKDGAGAVSGYRYCFEGYASLNARTVYAVGQYSTRDALLGKAGGNFRDPQEINESYIRQAAHTYFKGNAIKDLLGLKGIPWQEFEQLTAAAGQKAANASTVTHASGTKGGVSGDERSQRDELYKVLLELAQTNRVITSAEFDGKIVQAINMVGNDLAEYASKQKDPFAAVACASLRSLTTFKGKDGIVQGTTDFTRVKGKQLEITLKNAKELIAKAPSTEDWEKDLPKF